MSTTLTGFNITAPAITNVLANNGASLQSQIFNASINAALSLGLGSGASQANVAFVQTLSVTNGTPFTINLSSGNDAFGNVLGMVHVSTVLFYNLSTTTGQIFTIGSGTNPVLGTDSYTAQANGGIVFVCNPNPGYSVVGSTSDTLKIVVAAGTSVAANLIVLGRNA